MLRLGFYALLLVNITSCMVKTTGHSLSSENQGPGGFGNGLIYAHEELDFMIDIHDKPLSWGTDDWSEHIEVIDLSKNSALISDANTSGRYPSEIIVTLHPTMQLIQERRIEKEISEFFGLDQREFLIEFWNKINGGLYNITNLVSQSVESRDGMTTSRNYYSYMYGAYLEFNLKIDSRSSENQFFNEFFQRVRFYNLDGGPIVTTPEYVGVD